MVADGVLAQTKTRWGGVLYVPGVNYQRYLAAKPVAVA